MLVQHPKQLIQALAKLLPSDVPLFINNWAMGAKVLGSFDCTRREGPAPANPVCPLLQNRQIDFDEPLIRVVLPGKMVLWGGFFSSIIRDSGPLLARPQTKAMI